MALARFAKAMWEDAFDIRRGIQQSGSVSPLMLFAPFEEGTDASGVVRGQVVHHIKDPATDKVAFRIGLPEYTDTPDNAVPMFLLNNGADLDTNLQGLFGLDVFGGYDNTIANHSHPDNPFSPGFAAVVSTGAFEVYSTAYDKTQILEPGTHLTAGTGAALGLLVPGTPYLDIVCGVVSYGTTPSPYAVNKNLAVNPTVTQGLHFWTTYIPRLSKATVAAINALP